MNIKRGIVMPEVRRLMSQDDFVKPSKAVRMVEQYELKS